MVKNIVKAMVVIAAVVGMVGVVQSQPAKAKKDEVIICHRTNSISNPYVKLKVDADSVDGNAGNDNGQGDHYLEHTGPIADPSTMTNGDNWGDIIPAIPGVHDGRNWNEQGMAILEEGCDDVEAPILGYEVVCTEKGVEVILTNSGDAKGYVTVNGKEYKINAGKSKTLSFEVGTLVTIVIGEETVYERVVDCKADVSASLVCVESTSTFTMTLANNGTASADIELNGEAFVLGAGDSTSRNFVDDGNGVKLTLTVDGTVDSTYDGSRPFYCKQGQGSTDVPVVPAGGQGAATGVGSLPNTGSAGAQIASLIALVTTVGTAIGGYVLRNRGVSSL